jgi:putative DNA primase/helicase
MEDFAMNYPDQKLISALEDAGAIIRGKSVVCPFHDDHDPSGSIYEGDDGKWRYKCFGCDAAGDTADIIARHTGRPLAEVLKEQNKETGIPRQSSAKIKKEPKEKPYFGNLGDLAQEVFQMTLEAQYRYTNKDGKDILAVLRFPNKEFRQAHNTDKGWQSGGVKEPYPIYRQPDIANDPSAMVVVTEGEKDADALATIGVVATTAPMGADSMGCPVSEDGKPGKTDWSPLTGRNVVLWGDEDEPGRNHMVRVARCLSRLKPSPVIKVILIEDRHGTKDAAQLLEEKGEELVRIAIANAIPWIVTPPPLLFDLMAFADTPRGQVSWLWQDVIPNGMLSLVAGKQGLGKSYLLCDVAARVSTGNAMPDGTTSPPGNVLLLAREDDASLVLKPRLESAGADLARVQWSTFSSITTNEPMDISTHVGLLAETVKTNNIKLIVVDTFSAFAPIGTDANAAQSVRSVLDPLARLARQTGAAVVLVAHLRKSGQGEGEAMDAIAGSAQMTAGVRVACILEHGQTEGERWLHTVKSNLGPSNGNGWTFRFQTTTGNLVVSEVPKIQWTIAGDAYKDAQVDKRMGRVNVDPGELLNAVLSAIEIRPLTMKDAATKTWKSLSRKFPGLRKNDVEMSLEDLAAEGSSCFEVGNGQKGSRLIGLPGMIPEQPIDKARRLAAPGMTVNELQKLAGCRREVALEIIRELDE